jgi:hypothetical protein
MYMYSGCRLASRGKLGWLGGRLTRGTRGTGEV